MMCARRVVALVFVSVLFICLNATAIRINPTWVEFTGEYGQWVSKNITITNDENRSVNVTIEPSASLSGCYISNPSVTIPPHGVVNITLGVELTSDTYGFVIYSWDNQQMNQFVLLSPHESNVTVEMYPAEPQAGGSIVFLLNPFVEGIGFIYVIDSNAMHTFNITNGMAFTKLSPNDYGTAVAVFRGENFQARKVFYIKGVSGEEKELVINAPEEVNLSERKNVEVKYGNEPLSDVQVGVTEPDGDSYVMITDEEGKISVEFDEEGTWSFHASYAGKEADASVNVVAQSTQPQHNISLTISAPSKVKVGEKKWITLFMDNNPLPNTPMTVVYPDGSITAITTNQFGQYQFLFEQVGKYKFMVNYKGTTTQSIVTAEKREMNLTVPNSGLVGNYITITAEPKATITITGGGTEITDKIPSSGKYSFMPEKSGKYTVVVESDYAKGSAEITVYEKPTIVIYDELRRQVQEAKKNHQYLIYVTDSDGNVIESIPSVNVKLPSGIVQNIVLVEGEGVWTPDMAGQYIFSTKKYGFYDTATLVMTVKGSSGGELAGYAVLLACLIIVLVAVKYRKKIAERVGKLRKKEEKEEKEGEELE